MHTFYRPDLSASEVLLDEEESKHCIRVLRMQAGDRVRLVDGRGTAAEAVIVSDNPKKCLLHIESSALHKPLRSYRLHIAVAPTKNFDRMEWFIEKAVEAGVDEISFIECSNSERARVNMERCMKIAISAMKQSRQLYLPAINALASYEEVVMKASAGLKLVGWCETETMQQLKGYLHQEATNMMIMIGPEGDFTADEIALARQYGFMPVSFGESRLRTETAALYACMGVHALLG